MWSFSASGQFAKNKLATRPLTKSESLLIRSGCGERGEQATVPIVCGNQCDCPCLTMTITNYKHLFFFICIKIYIQCIGVVKKFSGGLSPNPPLLSLLYTKLKKKHFVMYHNVFNLVFILWMILTPIVVKIIIEHSKSKFKTCTYIHFEKIDDNTRKYSM